MNENNYSFGEKREMVQYKIEEIPPLGFGNSQAGISLDKKLEIGELSSEHIEVAAEIIKSGESMADITDFDDGCIDGRAALRLIHAAGSDDEQFTELDISNPFEHKRAKVAGGGYMTALSMKLALDPEITVINEDLRGLARHLTELGIYCGVHTGAHGKDGAVDCGANDRFEEILRTEERLLSRINQTVDALRPLCDGGENEAHGATAEASAGLSRTLSHQNYFTGSNGEARFDVIMDCIAETQRSVGGDKPLSVSKHLGGSHNEAFIILNTIKGKTFSQAALQQKLKERFPDVPDNQLPQAFVVDLPRVAQLARVMAEGRENSEEAFKVALQAGLAFQVATSATLTDGSLRMFVVQ